ncbi:hypothetical protein [Bifidobacterium callitrichidarum]|uniref:Leucine rich repeat variant n=1 Tax=Bifidobacterium callitrichidarum TaxID=2052941 RepID=A0A2U2N918_9BIFI|nr:hypothetical protein [Bifidobacterium callitrichidarum]PWG65665.1 hypothetical protein DF196_06955 [Bifidobacterium callitrichidarum]
MANYNEADHPRDPFGKYRDKDKSRTPNQLPEDSTPEWVRRLNARAVEKAESGEDLTPGEVEYLSRQAPEQVCQRLFEANNPTLDGYIISNENISDYQVDDILYRQPDDESMQTVREGVASRYGISDDLTNQCETWIQPDSQIPSESRRRIAVNMLDNPTMRSETINRILQQYPSSEIAEHAVRNPNSNDMTLALAVEHLKPNSDAYYDVEHNPQCGPRALHAMLAKKPYDMGRTIGVFSHPALDKETLEDYKSYCSYNNSDAALGASMNPSITPEMAEELYRSNYQHSGVIRDQLAANPATPDRILDEMMSQNDPYVDQLLVSNPSIGDARARKILNRAESKSTVCVEILNNKGLSEQFRSKVQLLDYSDDEW